MPEAMIEYKDCAGPWQPWAIRVGTRKQIEESARSLLEEIKEEYPRGQVSLVDGRGKRRGVRLNGRETEAQEDRERPRAVTTPFSQEFENPLG